MQLEQEKREVTDFKNLIFPIEPSAFEKNYWEQRTLLIQRENEVFYKALLSIKNVDQILDNSRPEGMGLRVVKNQEALNPIKYENKDGSLNLNQLYASYADGYTVIINEVERFWQPLRNLCQNLQDTFNHKTVANMYLTPKNQKALMPHYDTHDVYVLQIQGKKHWKLYDANYKTPILNSFQPIFQREQLKGEKDITVSAGDMLYIPRGVPHEAVTTDESSLHLTIGVYPTQWMDVMTKAIYQLAHTNLELRQSLPMGFLNGKQSPEIFQPKLQSLFETVTKNIDAQGALQFVAEEFRTKQRPMGDGHFTHLNQLDEISLETKLCPREHMNPKVQNMGSVTRIIFSGNVIKGPGHIAPCFEFIANAKDGFKVNQIPLLNNANKIKLSKRLVRGGLLKIARNPE